MRNKKLLSTVVATTMAATTMVMPVMAADGGSFNVGVTTKTPVIRVVVPTTMQIAVNQFEMGDAGSQIYSNVFEMENKSEIPVKLNVTSTATPGANTTLVATKAGATDSTKAGEAWLAAAAQIEAGKYIADGKTINDLTEASANVATFVENKAEQTYYLNASSSMAYKLLNTNESAADIEYAQFYELTAKTFTATSESDELKALVKDQDVYYAASTTITDGMALTKLAKGSDTSSLTWSNSNTYYTVAQVATPKASIDTANHLYVYGNGTTDAAGKAAFRYIGKLSGKQESWSASDLTTIGVAYTIVGVQQNDFDALAAETGTLTYGLYKAPAPTEKAPSIPTATAKMVSGQPATFNVDLGAGDLKATGIASIANAGTTTAIPSSAYSFANGVLTITAERVNTLLNAGLSSKKYDVTFDDKAKTVVTITLEK